jgi:hypothetical protein
MADDEYSLPNRIAKAQARIARQREIVEELNRYGCGESAQKLLELMEQTLASLHEMEREQHSPAGPADDLLMPVEPEVPSEAGTETIGHSGATA